MNDTHSPVPTPSDSAASQSDEINFFEILATVLEGKWIISGFTLISGLIGLGIALWLPPIYTAKTTLLPPQQNQSTLASLSASLGALSGMAGLGGIKSPDDMYIALLKSRSIADNLIEKYQLKDRLEADSMQKTYTKLNEVVRAQGDKKSSLISIEVDDKNPQFAADLANAYVTELRKLMARLAVTEAQQRRVFFEQQMSQAKEAMIKAELAAKDAQERSGLLSVDAQTQGLIAAAAQLRAQIMAKEVQLQTVRPYAGPDNPELKRLLSEMSGLRSQLAKLESGNGNTSTATDPDNTQSIATPSSKKTQALANVRLYRELKYQEAVYTALLQQFQLAKADEARDAPLIQQIDVATAPDRKSKPQNKIIIILSIVIGAILGLAFVFIRSMLKNNHRRSYFKTAS